MAIGLSVAAGQASASEGGDLASRSLDEISIDILNPVSPLFSIASDLSHEPHQGDLPAAGEQVSDRWLITPTLPIQLNSGKRLVARFSIPISLGTPTYAYEGVDHTAWLIRQRADQLGDEGVFYEGHGHLDDIGFDLAYGGERDNGAWWMAGISGALRTSEDLSIAREQYLLGPEFAYGRKYDWGMFGAWFSHLVDVSSGGNPYIPYDYDTNESRLRVIYAYGLGNGWHFVSQPEMSYDWEGADGNRLTLPLGGGVSKTLRLGRVPLNLGLEGYYFASSPDAFGPQWQIRFRITPVISRALFAR